MPTYEYRCPEGHTFEEFQKMSADPVAKCPECGGLSERLISGGAGLHFKGSGFYITDYGKDGKGPRKEPETGGKKPKEDATKKPAKPAKDSSSASSVSDSSTSSPKKPSE